MKSHQYDFSLRQLVRLILGLFVPIIIFAAVLRLGALARLFPAPWPLLDVDHTILTHQADASRTASRADVVLIGDSSCLMDVSGKRLETLSRRRSLNLGTFMYVGLNGYAGMLSRYVSLNPGSIRTVVVLLHPEMLRGIEPIPEYMVFLSDYYSGADYSESSSLRGQLRGLFGLHIFQDRFLTRIPLALPKEYGRFYGFNLDLYRFMDEQHGSAVDPHQYVAGPGQGRAEYRLSPMLEPGCTALKAAVPSEAKLLFGLTPIPQSFAPNGYDAQWHALLVRCGQWLKADRVLTNLPPTLPDSLFASTSHLNQQGSLKYAELLARELGDQ